MVSVAILAVVLAVVLGSVTGLATYSVTGRWWVAMPVACLWAAGVTFVLWAPL